MPPGLAVIRRVIDERLAATHDARVDEPQGQTIDGAPWEEARGPHLPDRLTRVGPIPILFTILAIVMAALSISRFQLTLGPFWTVSEVIASIPTVVAFLLPAALFLRHPDAWRTFRLLAVGTVLFGVVEILQFIAPGLDTWFGEVIPPSEDLPFLAPLSVGFNVVVGLLGAAAPFFVGRGLLAARQYENGDGSGRWWLIVAAMTVVAGVTQVAMLLNLSLDIPADAVIAYFWITVVSVAIGILALLGWAYLAGTAMVGWRSSEEPYRGWALAAFGGVAVLAGLLISGVIGVNNVFATPLPNEVGIVVVTCFGLGYLALFLGFLAGLPEVEEA